MKLCMTTHVKFFRTQNGYILRPGFNKFLHVISPIFDDIELCVPVYDEKPPKDYTNFQISNIKICPLLPYYKRWEIGVIWHLWSIMKSLWFPIKRADIIWLLMPNHLSTLAWLVCLFQKKCFAIRMVGNWPRMFWLAFEKRGIPLMGNIASGLCKLLLECMISTSKLTLTTGQELIEMFGRNSHHMVPFVSSTFKESDIATGIASSGSDECHILYVGRLDNYKGLREVVFAFKDLIQEGHKVSLRVVGAGNLQLELERLVEQLKVQPYVDFRGWVPMGPELQREYRTSDVLVLASYAEGSPKVVIEAMSNGLPVVATGVGAVPMVVREGENGFIVPTHDSGAIRDALRKIITDESLRKRMAERGLKQSRSFTMEAERKCVAEAFKKFGLLPSDGKD